MGEENPVFPKGIILLKDTGFQGYEPEGTDTRQPKKKPRGGELSVGEKVGNSLISGVRIVAEHVISGVKRCRIAEEKFRNTKKDYDDLVMEIACGLDNPEPNVDKLRIEKASLISDNVYSNTCGSATIPPEGTCTLTITFKPQTAGTFSEKRTVNSDASNSPVQVSLTGTGIGETSEPAIAVSCPYTCTSYDFGNIDPNPEVPPIMLLIISNTGTAPLNISGMELDESPNIFKLDPELTSPEAPACGTRTPTIAPGEKCGVTVSFNPIAVMQYNTELTITSDASNQPVLNIPLKGSSGAAVRLPHPLSPALSRWMSNFPLTCGTVPHIHMNGILTMTAKPTRPPQTEKYGTPLKPKGSIPSA